MCEFGSFLLRDMFFNFEVFALEGQRVAYLHSILWCRARLWLELFTSTVGRFLSQVSYLPCYIFLWRYRSFTLRKVCSCPEKFLCFCCTIWLSLCFWSFTYRCLPPLITLVPQDLNVTRTSLLTVLRVVYAIIQLSSGKTMVSILHASPYHADRWPLKICLSCISWDIAMSSGWMMTLRAFVTMSTISWVEEPALGGIPYNSNKF